MVRTGHQPHTRLRRRLWRYADVVCRYAVNLMLAAAVIAAYVS